MQKNPFATEAAQYAHLRPTYPEDLFQYLASVGPSRGVAWDCATGNGQAATHLAGYFERVVATDESGEMIAQAPRDPRIVYRVAEAEASGLEGSSVDLVTVASAVHWFDLRSFYAEVRRVVKPGGTIAVWTYYTPEFGGDIDAIIRRLAHDVLGPYWDERVHYVVDEFHDLPFPFELLEAPSFQTDMVWDMHDLLAYFETWSSSIKYREANHVSPTSLIKDDLTRAWGDPEQKRDLRFPLYMRLGRVGSSTSDGEKPVGADDDQCDEHDGPEHRGEQQHEQYPDQPDHPERPEAPSAETPPTKAPPEKDR